MDLDLPGYAWDLLPYLEHPLDLYRSHVWHANSNEQKRTPYAAIYTSLGCIYGCEFCMINNLNRADNSVHVSSRDSRLMRFWSVKWVLKQLQQWYDMGVTTIRISDKMFLLIIATICPFARVLLSEGSIFTCGPIHELTR